MNKKYTIELTEDEMIKYYANKIVEDALEDCSEFHYCTDLDQYEDNGFVEQHYEEILDKIKKDERVAEVYIDKSYVPYTFNMCFWLDYCPYYYESTNLEPETERMYLNLFIKQALENILEYPAIHTTRDMIRTFMDNFIEKATRLDEDKKDEVYYSIKEHICNTGFNEKYIDKYEVYVDKNNVKELIEGLEKEIDILHIKEHANIKQISYYNFLELLNKFNKQLKFANDDLGKFITKENGIYLGINNENGEMKMQDFDDIEKCLEYLETEDFENEEIEER